MLRFIWFFCLGLALAGCIGTVAVVAYLLPRLPSVEVLRDIQLQEPLRVYSRDFQLVAEFGDKRRTPVALADIPETLINAFLVTEDEHFFQHSGVDPLALMRATLSALKPNRRAEGASTITMQLARNIFLSSERTLIRKLNEILLAFRIESSFDKSSILELYLNKVYLGQRSYGIGAAALTYYGKALDELSLPEMAMLAGLPKAPSKINPITDPEAALVRRRHVLNRLLVTGKITAEQHAAAVDAPETARLHGTESAVFAPHLAEMVRSELVARYGEEVYNSGLRVITTLDSRLQARATLALQKGILDYERRHGYRGPEGRLDASALAAGVDAALKGVATIGGLSPGVVVDVGEQSATVVTRDYGRVELPWEALSWARRFVDVDQRGPAPKRAKDVVQAGDIVRVERVEVSETETDSPTEASATPRTQWRLAHLPKVEGALVALDPKQGAILALVGGFDFTRSKFNRVTQARRQPGSNFKPFVYSSALDAGFTPASFVNDAPIVFETPGVAEAWRPENYSGRYYGPTRLREALAKSRNLVSIRLLRSVGVERALDFVTRYGFRRDSMPRNLSLALGTGEVTPLELVRGYAVLANGGFAVEPHFIHRVDNRTGEVLSTFLPKTACTICDDPALQAGEPAGLIPDAERAPRVVDATNVWLMTSMLKDVVRYGTAQRAMSLKRTDLAGKTGTTNDQKDAWFSGYNADVVATTWIGFDQSQPLGKQETGAKAALPIWIDFMEFALAGKPPAELAEPAGLVAVRIDPDTGLRASQGEPQAITEYFPANRAPGDETPTFGIEGDTSASPDSNPSLDQPLF